MLQNEQIKLHSLYQTAQAQELDPPPARSRTSGVPTLARFATSRPSGCCTKGVRCAVRPSNRVEPASAQRGAVRVGDSASRPRGVFARTPTATHTVAEYRANADLRRDTFARLCQ